MARYHINPKTGNPGTCKAERRCPFGSDDKHFSSKEIARDVAESHLEVETQGEQVVFERVKALADHEDTNSFNTIRYELDLIEKWPSPWTREEKSNLALVQQLAKRLKSGELTPEKFAESEELLKKLHPYKDIRQTVYRGKADEPHLRRDKALVGLATSLVVQAEAKLATYPKAPPRERAEGFIGLDEARRAVLRTQNTSYGYISYSEDVEEHLDETLDRVADGQKVEMSHRIEGLSVLPARDRLLHTIGDPEGDRYDSKMYLSLAWPEQELGRALKRAQVDNVAVGSFENGREWGLTYTALDPEGNARVFSVYEHRNTDSIVINGKTNPAPGDLPYVADSKQAFFAEFAADERHRAADTLAFFLKEAQAGELADDASLAASAPKRDWRAILSASVPGFADWDAKHYGPRDPDLDDPLKRLDF